MKMKCTEKSRGVDLRLLQKGQTGKETIKENFSGCCRVPFRKLPLVYRMSFEIGKSWCSSAAMGKLTGKRAFSH